MYSNKPRLSCPLGSASLSSKHKVSNVDNTSIQLEHSMPFWPTHPSNYSMESNDSPRTYTSDPMPDQRKLLMLKKKTLVRAQQAAQQYQRIEKQQHEEVAFVGGSKSPQKNSNGVHGVEGMRDNRSTTSFLPAAIKISSTGINNSGCCETGASGDAELMTPRDGSPTPSTSAANVSKCQNGQQVEQMTWTAVPGHNVTPPRPNNVPTVAQTARLPTVTNRADATDYLNFEDIRPSSNPKTELNEVLQGLGKQTWPGIFHQLNAVRRLALHHRHMLEPHAHTIVLGVANQADNLRSQVSKNALLCLGDMWKGMGKALDPELKVVAPAVIKKSADKVEFIREAAELAIKDIIAGGSDSKVIAAFLICMGPGTPGLKNSFLRAKIAAALRMCLTVKGQQLALTASKEVKRIVYTLGSLLQDSSQETREHSKKIASLLVETGIMTECELRKALPETVISRIKLILQAASTRRDKYNHPVSLASTSPPRMVQGNRLLLGTDGPIRDDCSSRQETFSHSVGTTANGFIAPPIFDVGNEHTSSLQHKVVADGELRNVSTTTEFLSTPSIRINCDLPSQSSSLSP